MNLGIPYSCEGVAELSFVLKVILASNVVKHFVFNLDVAILFNVLIEHLSIHKLGHESFVTIFCFVN